MSLHLKPNPTLRDFQDYVEEMKRERGFSGETLPEVFMLLLEECGEFAKAARKHTRIKIDPNAKRGENPAHEAADVLIYLLCLSNMLGIDLEKAFREKEEINKKRVWK